MTSVSTSHARALRVAAGVAAAAALCIVLAGCQPEPVPSASPDTGASASGSASPLPSATATPSESAPAVAGITLPAACDQIVSPAMLASLEQQGPLNDPGVTMTSTQNVEALEILGSGIPTLRCTWGAPSESGLATNVSIVDEAQATAISEALINAGFGCTPVDGGTTCAWEQETITLDDELVELTETHLLRGNGWVTTYTIDFDDAGYSEDVMATLWG